MRAVESIVAAREVARATVASIPSPSSPEIGPLHVYGVLLAIGVLLAVEVAERRWRRRGGAPGGVYDVAFAVVLSGVIGARLYHVATDHQRFEGHWSRVIEVWNGGLSIWGAVIGGALALVVVCRRRGLGAGVLMDCIAPGLLAAQALGRWGNWWNQELFGRPTDLPWALEIDRVHRPARFADRSTFHPTFLYESLWCLLVLVAVLALERAWRHRGRLRAARVFAAYVTLYSFGRFWFENLRVDPAERLGPLRFNAWVALLATVGGLGWSAWLARSPAGPRPEPDRPTTDGAGGPARTVS